MTTQTKKNHQKRKYYEDKSPEAFVANTTRRCPKRAVERWPVIQIDPRMQAYACRDLLYGSLGRDFRTQKFRGDFRRLFIEFQNHGAEYADYEPELGWLLRAVGEIVDVNRDGADKWLKDHILHRLLEWNHRMKVSFALDHAREWLPGHDCAARAMAQATKVWQCQPNNVRYANRDDFKRRSARPVCGNHRVCPWCLGRAAYRTFEQILKRNLLGATPYLALVPYEYYSQDTRPKESDLFNRYGDLRKINYSNVPLYYTKLRQREVNDIKKRLIPAIQGAVSHAGGEGGLTVHQLGPRIVADQQQGGPFSDSYRHHVATLCATTNPDPNAIFEAADAATRAFAPHGRRIRRVLVVPNDAKGLRTLLFGRTGEYNQKFHGPVSWSSNAGHKRTYSGRNLPGAYQYQPTYLFETAMWFEVLASNPVWHQKMTQYFGSWDMRARQGSIKDPPNVELDNLVRQAMWYWPEIEKIKTGERGQPPRKQILLSQMKRDGIKVKSKWQAPLMRRLKQAKREAEQAAAANEYYI